MGNEVAVKQNTAVSTEVQSWGQDVTVGKDLLISKILTMQPNSDMVTDGDAKLGEFRDSITKELYGSFDGSPVQFVPFHARKMWSISERKEGEQNFEWVKTVNLVEDPTRQDYNDNWEWEHEREDGTVEKRVRRLDFFCLPVAQLKTGSAMPVMISFQSTSYKSGQILLNQMYVRNKMLKKSPAAVIMALGGDKIKNDKGTYIVTNVKPVAQTPAEYEAEAKNWYNMINAGKSNVIIDESDETKGQTPATPTGDVSAGRF